MVDAVEEPPGLRSPGDVQEHLDNADAVVDEMVLPLVDLLITPLPYLSPPSRFRQPLSGEQLRVYPHHQDLLVVRAVEDADSSPRRQVPLIAPQVVMLKLLDRGLLEAAHLNALGIDTAHHVLDRAVLAG